MTVSRETGTPGQERLESEAFARLTGVSRETLDRLKLYSELLGHWQKRINLVGASTLDDPWRRHFLDSAQLFDRLPPGDILDMGSGAGFPGLVLAVMRGPAAPAVVHLAESDARKCAFLREVARQTGAVVEIHCQRLEKIKPFQVAAITARALAPLAKLLEWAEPFTSEATEMLFLKGRGGEEELTEAAKDWNMSAERIASLSDPSGVVFHLKEVSRGRD